MALLSGECGHVTYDTQGLKAMAILEAKASI